MSILTRHGFWRRRPEPACLPVDQAAAAGNPITPYTFPPRTKRVVRSAQVKSTGTRRALKLINSLFPKRPETAPPMRG